MFRFYVCLRMSGYFVKEKDAYESETGHIYLLNGFINAYALLLTIYTMLLLKWLDNNKDIGILLFRLFIGIRLIYGVADNILSWAHMQAFERFLASNGFPFPLFSAMLSAYSQFICGLLIISGFGIRLASLLMIINFVVALIMVHRHDTVEAMTPALSMLFASVLFLFCGAGRFSL